MVRVLADRGVVRDAGLARPVGRGVVPPWGVIVARFGPVHLSNILLSRIETEALGTFYLTGWLELWSRPVMLS